MIQYILLSLTLDSIDELKIKISSKRFHVPTTKDSSFSSTDGQVPAKSFTHPINSEKTSSFDKFIEEDPSFQRNVDVTSESNVDKENQGKETDRNCKSPIENLHMSKKNKSAPADIHNRSTKKPRITSETKLDHNSKFNCLGAPNSCSSNPTAQKQADKTGKLLLHSREVTIQVIKI